MNSTQVFDWADVEEMDGSLAAADASLFPQVRCSERRLSELIFRPGRKIIIRNAARLEQAKVETVFEKMLFVNFGARSDFVSIDDVVPDNVLRISTKQEESEDEGTTACSDCCDELTVEDLEMAHLTMAEAIKPGQYFEMQDRINPCKVYIVKVFENRGGLLLISRNGEQPDTARPERGEPSENHCLTHIFMTDERCHAIGWLETGAQSNLYFAEGAESLVEAAKENPVTKWVFEHFKVKEHKFQVNRSLEVLQAANGGSFYAGHVTEIINSHYFVVKIAESLTGMEKTITCSKSHSQIFPSGWCQRHGLRLTPPSDYNGEEEFSMLVYEAKLQLKGKAPDSLFDPPKALCKPERLRNVEILDIRTKNEMYPAKILRWMKHIVWISYAHYSNATPPGVLSTRCGLIFPCGFAAQHNIKLCKPCSYKSLEATANDRLGLRETCTTFRTPVFIPRTKRFLPAVYLDNDLVLPAVYVRKTCFCGPFLDPAKVKLLPEKYTPGPLPAVLRLILADVISAAHKPEDLSKLLSCAKDTTAPVMFAKTRVYGKPIRFRVECCEKVTEFSGWMRNVCVLLDACPELFGLSSDPCTSYCQYLSSIPLMSSEKHLWTASVQSATTPPRRMRIDSGNAAQRQNAPQKRRKRMEKTTTAEARRPVTRAVLRKTIRSPKSEEPRPVSSSPPKKESPKLLGEKISPLRRRLLEAGKDEAGPLKKLRKSASATPMLSTISPEEKRSRRGRKVQNLQEALTLLNVAGTSEPVQRVKLQAINGSSDSAKPQILVSPQVPVTLQNAIAAGPSQSEGAPARRIGINRLDGAEPVRTPPVLSNPMNWNCSQLSEWLLQTDVAALTDLLAKDEVDGEAFMLLTLDGCVNTLKIKLGPAMKLESLSKSLKAHYERYFRDAL